MAYQPKSYRKFLATGVATAMVATAVAPAVSADEHVETSFTDVPEGSWYADNLGYVVERGIIEGYTDGTFRPDGQITRAEVAAVVKRAMDLDASATPNLEFTDTSDTQWYAAYVQAVVDAGYMQGDPGGTFRPNAPMSRGEFARVMVNAFDLELDENADISFSDLDAEDTTQWYYEDVMILASLGIVDGFTDGTFRAETNVNRAQATAFVHRTEVPEVRVEVPQKEAEEVTVSSVEAVNSYNNTTVTAQIAGPVEEDTEVTFEIFAFGDTDEDAAAEEVVEIDEAGEVEVVFEFLPAGDHVARVSVGEDYMDVEFTVEDNLFITSIDSFNRDGLTVNFVELADAKEDVTIDVVDNEGNEVAVDPVDLVEGETVATFDFETRLAEEPEGIWTVNGVEYDFELQELLSDLNSASTQLAFYNALVALNVDNVNSDNARQYFEEGESENFTSLNQVQEFVNDVNSMVERGATSREILEALEDALASNNDVRILSTLNEYFERVNADIIQRYKDNATFDNLDTESITNFQDAYDDVQDAIDDENESYTGDLIDDSEDSLDRDDYSDAVDSLSFIKDDEDDVTTKADFEERLSLQNSFLRVIEASTQAQLTVAYNNYVSLVDNTSLVGDEPFYSAARADYLDVIDALENSDAQAAANNATLIEDAIAEGNLVAQFSALEEIESIEDGGANETSLADVKSALEALADVTSDDEFDYSDVRTDDATVELYRVEFDGFTLTASDATDVTEIADDIETVANTIENVNNSTGLTVLESISTHTGDAAAFLELLQDSDLGLENVISNNADEYQDAAADLASAVETELASTNPYTLGDGTDGSTSQQISDAISLLDDEIEEINLIKDINEADTASQSRTALTSLSLKHSSEFEAFIDLSSNDRLIVAELFLDDDVFDVSAINTDPRETDIGDYTYSFDVTFADKGVNDIKVDLDELVDAVNDLVSDMNERFNDGAVQTPSISGVQSELAKLVHVNFDEYDELSGAEKLEVAEQFISDFPTDSDGDFVQNGYRSFNAYLQAVEAAIEEVTGE